MRILVTGVSGLLGRTTAGLMAGAGHEVVGISRTAPLEVPRGVEYRSVDVRDAAALVAAAVDVDTVIHCAFMLDARAGHDAMRETNVEGTRRVAEAAAAAGARRLVFISSATVYGPRHASDDPASSETTVARPHPSHPYASHKLATEEVVLGSGLEPLVVRAPIILGRGTDNRLQEALARRLHIAASDEYPWQLIHHDDLARFLVGAAAPGAPTGIVNVTADGLVSMSEIARRLGRRPLVAPPRLLHGVAALAAPVLGVTTGEVDTMLHMPVLDNARMRDEFGFEPAWTADEVVADTVLAVEGRITRRGTVRERSGRCAYRHQILPADAPAPDGVALEAAADVTSAGEFDTPIDPRFPVYSQTNLSEALPGPSTPLTIDVVGRALRGTTSAVADLLQLDGTLHTEASARLQGVFGGRFFINASGTFHVGTTMPGTSPGELIDQFVGRHGDSLPSGPDGGSSVPGSFVPATDGAVRRARRIASVTGGVLGSLRSTAKLVDASAHQVARYETLTADLPAASDARVDGLLLLGRDLLTYLWTTQGVVNLVSGATLSLAERSGSGEGMGHGEDLQSSAALRGVHRLATSMSARPEVLAEMTADGPELAARIEAADPAFWSEVLDALAEFGHRGPGECELAARSFQDDLPALLRTVHRVATARREESQRQATPRRAGRAAGLARRMLAHRERNRDRTVRATWLYRRVVLERGRRLVAAGVLDAPDDVFYLTAEALLTPPADVRAIVAARRAERERMRALHLPPIFAHAWSAEGGGDRLRAGESLQGIGICAGVVRGRVRVVEPETVDDFEDGEVLVAHVTDVGYTPLFALASAVVTDIGGQMSHAAVVAREFGVPTVVDLQVAANRLRTGDLVEVDGASGVLTMIEPAPAG